MTPAIVLKSYLALFLLGVILLCALRIPPSPARIPLSPWRHVPVSDKAVQPLVPPAVLSNAILWQPLSSNELVFSGSENHRHNWLRGNLASWQALEAQRQIFLVWQTLEGQLFSAVLGENGEQQSAPERLDLGGEMRSFVALAPSDLVVLGVRQDRRVFLRRMDTLGRPYLNQNLEIAADHMAAAAHSDSELLLAWQSGRSLYVGMWDIDSAQLRQSFQIPSFQLPAQSWLADLQIILTPQQQIILWGITFAQMPDRQSYGGVILPRLGLADPQTLSLNLPTLRWGHVQGQEATFAALLDDKWQAIKVTFGESGALGYQVIDGEAVTASPIGFGNGLFAWATLDDSLQPRLYATSLEQGDWRYPEEERDWRKSVWAGLARLPWAMLWVIFPVLAGIYGQKLRFENVVVFYWLGKSLLPLGFWRHYPQTLFALGIESPFWGVGISLFLISLAALAMASLGWRDTQLSIRHAAYYLTDAFLTCAILGASLE